MHVAHLRRIERPRTVHGRLIVPDHQIKLSPLVRIHELSLRRVLDQIAQEGARLRNRPSDDRSGMRGEITTISAQWMDGGLIRRCCTGANCRRSSSVKSPNPI